MTQMLSLTIILLTAVLAACAAHPGLDSLYISEEFIQKLKKDKSLSWTPERVFGDDMYLKRLFSENHKCSEEQLAGIPVVEDIHHQRRLPKFFDARKKWKYCPSIAAIEERSNCLALWATSVASVLSDRFCIVTKGKVQVELSAQHMLSCCKDCGDCEKGGSLCQSWKYVSQNGLVTGGSYNSQKGCYPYEIEPCGNPGQHLCSPDVPVPSECVTQKCKNSKYHMPFERDLYRAELPYRLANSTNTVKHEIIKNGPVTALIKVYKDFLAYKKGIYKRKSSEEIGEMTVKIIGWGKKNHHKYWLIANSWGQNWGEKGLFRLAIDADNFVEGHILVAHPAKSRHHHTNKETLVKISDSEESSEENSFMFRESGSSSQESADSEGSQESDHSEAIHESPVTQLTENGNDWKDIHESHTTNQAYVNYYNRESHTNETNCTTDGAIEVSVENSELVTDHNDLLG